MPRTLSESYFFTGAWVILILDAQIVSRSVSVCLNHKCVSPKYLLFSTGVLVYHCSFHVPTGQTPYHLMNIISEGERLQFNTSDSVHRCETVLLHVWKEFPEAFCGSRGSCVKSDKLPQAMSLESASVGLEDNRFEMKRSLKVWSWSEEGLWLKATLGANYHNSEPQTKLFCCSVALWVM